MHLFFVWIQYDLVFKTRYDLLFTHNVANNCDLLTDITKLNKERIDYAVISHFDRYWKSSGSKALYSENHF